MKKSKRKINKEYLEQAKGWEYDIISSAMRSRKRAWALTAFSLILVALSVTAVLALTPLKTVKPLIIRVDNVTGIVDVIEKVDVKKIKQKEILSKYFLIQYIQKREGFIRATAETDFEIISLLSSPEASQRYYKYYNPSNPSSPLNIYTKETVVNAEIKSVSFISENVASVRFYKKIVNGKEEKINHYIASIEFDYESVEFNSTKRAVNPLGFQVKKYRLDRESS